MSFDVDVKINRPSTIIDRLGIAPGGKTFIFFMTEIERHMNKYLPYRDNGSVVDAMNIGRDTTKGQWVFNLPYAKYLYYGKAMAGKPKKPIDKNLVYTKDVHPQAGPFWDKSIMTNDIKKIAKSVEKFMGVP